MRKELEVQCLAISPEDCEDMIYIRNVNGKLERVEVEDDDGDN